MDTSFDVGIGLDNSAQALADRTEGNCGGLFTSVNGVSRNRLARLNSDRSVDDTFNPGGVQQPNQRYRAAVRWQSGHRG